MLKTFHLVTVSTKPKEILHQMLQDDMRIDFHTPANNQDYYPFIGT